MPGSTSGFWNRRLVPEKQVLQISNDISEDTCSASRKELVEVAKYFRDKYDALNRATVAARTDTGLFLLRTGLAMLKGKPVDKSKLAGFNPA